MALARRRSPEARTGSIYKRWRGSERNHEPVDAELDDIHDIYWAEEACSVDALRGPRVRVCVVDRRGVGSRHTGRMSHRFHGHEWGGQALRIARLCAAWSPKLVGVYVHGSAALGGFGPASDLDVLVVTDGGSNWPALGAQLLAECGGPRTLGSPW